MSALRKTNPTIEAPSTPAREPVDWIPVQRAASLLGVTERHLRRVCSEELAPKGSAKQISLGSKPVWHIHCSYDYRLGREHVASIDQSLAEVWASATDAQRHKALTKAKVLIAFRALIANPKVQLKSAFPSFRARMKTEHGIAPAQRTLYRWNEQCPPSSSPIAIGAALIDARNHTAGQFASEAAIEMFRSFYLTPGMTVAQCYRLVKAEAEKQGWAWPALRTVQINVDKWVDPEMQTMAREGIDAWRRKYGTPIDQDPEAFKAGECWEADHTELDFFIRVPARGGGWTHDRPWLTCWMDRRSRRIVGWHLGLVPDSDAIRAALIRAFKDGMAIPSYAVMDNGKDFASAAIAGLTKKQRRALRSAGRRPTKAEREKNEKLWGGILGTLGIEAHFNLPYNKDGKGRVERLMRTVHQTFDNTFLSYRGSENVKVPSEHIKKILASPENLPSLDQAIAKFTEWVEWYNNRDEHNIQDLFDAEARTKISPAEFYSRNLFRQSYLKDDHVLNLLMLKWPNEPKVTGSGVGIKVAGRIVNYGARHPAITPLTGQNVRVCYDPNDMNEIHVFSTDGRFIATVEPNSLHGGFNRGPVSEEALKAAMHHKRAEQRRISKPIDMLAITGDAMEEAVRQQQRMDRDATASREAERRGQRKVEDMPPIRLVSTPLDEEAAKLEAQKKQRNARRVAGFESVSVPSYEDVFAQPDHTPSIADRFGLSDDGPEEQEPTDRFEDFASDPDEVDDFDDEEDAFESLRLSIEEGEQ